MTQGEELTPIGAAVLGLLLYGDDASGYELRQRAENTLRFFFASPSMSQVYAEIERLAAAGLVADRMRREPGRRPARVWRLTTRGRKVLQMWAAGSEVPPTAIRHHLALRVMLGATTGPDVLQGQISDHRERVETDLADLRAVRDSIAEESDPVYVHARLVAEWGAATFEAELAALDRLSASLASHARAGPPGDSLNAS